MEPADSDERIAALREEILRAGRRVFAARLTVAVPLALHGFLLGAGSVWGTPPQWRDPYSWIAFIGLGIGGAALLGGGLGVLLCWCAWVQLSGRLPAVRGQDRRRCLESLVEDRSGDTRKLARALLRDLSFATELTPAAAPGARGSETSPAGHER
jgi:hypothetical protein